MTFEQHKVGFFILIVVTQLYRTGVRKQHEQHATL